MIDKNSALAPENWLHNVFQAQAVLKGQTLRRKLRDVERYCGLEPFLREVKARGFQAYRNRDQIIVICNQEPLKKLT